MLLSRIPHGAKHSSYVDSMLVHSPRCDAGIYRLLNQNKVNSCLHMFVVCWSSFVVGGSTFEKNIFSKRKWNQQEEGLLWKWRMRTPVLSVIDRHCIQTRRVICYRPITAYNKSPLPLSQGPILSPPHFFMRLSLRVLLRVRLRRVPKAKFFKPRLMGF